MLFSSAKRVVICYCSCRKLIQLGVDLISFAQSGGDGYANIVLFCIFLLTQGQTFLCYMRVGHLGFLAYGFLVENILAALSPCHFFKKTYYFLILNILGVRHCLCMKFVKLAFIIQIFKSYSQMYHPFYQIFFFFFTIPAR